MGKLAEIKDMEEAVEQENNEAKEFIRFTKRQEDNSRMCSWCSGSSSYRSDCHCSQKRIGTFRSEKNYRSDRGMDAAGAGDSRSGTAGDCTD